MRVLFDHGTPRLIANALRWHEVTHLRQIGWDELKNGKRIQRADEAGYDVLLSTDKNLQYQQNLAGRKISVVILGHPQ